METVLWWKLPQQVLLQLLLNLRRYMLGLLTQVTGVKVSVDTFVSCATDVVPLHLEPLL